MTTVRRIAKNVAFLFSGDAIAAVLGIILVVFFARYLGAAEYGKYVFAVAFTSLFLILADLGLSSLSIREIARDNRKAAEYLTTVSVVKVVLSIVMIGLIALVINILDYPGDTVIVVYVIGSMHVFNSFSVFLRSIFRAFEKMEYDAITRITERLLVVGSAITALSLGYELRTVVIVMLIAQAFTFLFTLAVCIGKFTRPQMKFDFKLAKKMTATALPIAIAGVFGTLIFQIDSVMLSMMKGDATVGWYNAAFRPVMGMLFLPGIYVGATLPVISRYFVTDRDKLFVVYRKSIKMLATLAVPFAVGTTLVAGRVILLLYGEEFAESVIALQILSWAVAFIFLSIFLNHILVSIDKQGVQMRIIGACVILNIILNFSLIPAFSYIGAGIASVISQFVILIWEYIYLQKHLVKVNLPALLVKPLLASLVMGVFVYLLGIFLADTIPGLIAIILAAVVVYILLIYLLKVFNGQELQEIKNIFSRRILGNTSSESSKS